MKRPPITGGCYCGQVRYRAIEEPIYQANCHCTNCRRAAGAQAVAWSTSRSSAFEWEKQAPRRYYTETGAWRTFRELCGTVFTDENDTRPGEIDITTGSLDRPEDFPPQKDVFPEEKLPWVALVNETRE